MRKLAYVVETLGLLAEPALAIPANPVPTARVASDAQIATVAMVIGVV